MALTYYYELVQKDRRTLAKLRLLNGAVSSTSRHSEDETMTKKHENRWSSVVVSECVVISNQVNLIILYDLVAIDPEPEFGVDMTTAYYWILVNTQ